MAKKVSENNILSITEDWGLDTSNNLPYSGAAVQKFIKDTFDTKIGYFHYDVTTNRYLVFANVAKKDEYLENPTLTELVLGSFDAPFNYDATVTLFTPQYNAVFFGSTGNYLDFTFDIKNKAGASTGENVTITYTFIRNATKKVVTETRRYGESVHFDIDDYLLEGTNTIIIGVSGQTTLAATTVALTYNVVNLQYSDEIDISKVYDLSRGTYTMEVFFNVSGYGTKIVEWFLDGNKLDFVKSEDEVVDVTSQRIKYIELSNLTSGIHTIQSRAYTLVNGEKFYTDTLYREIMVNNGDTTANIVAVAANVPHSHGIVTENNPFLFYGAEQYIPYEIRFATRKTGNVQIYLGNDPIVTLVSSANIESHYSITSNKSGTLHIKFVVDNIEREIPLSVNQTSLNIEEITTSISFDFRATGKSNTSVDKDVWSYGDYTATFEGFNWNASSGWVDNSLLINNGASFSVDISPLAKDGTSTGKTLEFEFSTRNVENDDAVICDLTTNGKGLLITASEARLTSAAGETVSTRFKAGEVNRIAFVINRKTGVTYKGLVFIYVNGILSGAVNYGSADNFTSTKQLMFVGTEDAQVELRAMRFYDTALSADNVLNNYVIYRDTLNEMMEVYYRNEIYAEGTQSFSPDAMLHRLPVMVITGDVPTLEAATSTSTQILVDIDYTNEQDPTKNFKMKNAALRIQGTSSLAYPRKNFRFYTQKEESTLVYDANGKIIQNKRYSFKDGAQPVDCWCLKADFAESSGTHNTAIARLWNKVMYGAIIQHKNVLGEEVNGYALRTNAQIAALNAGYEYDVRTTIDGFPIVLFYKKNANDTDLIFLGKYNFNNDKSTPSVFGFENIPDFDNSRMQCWETKDNGHPLGLFTDVSGFDADWSEAFESRYPDTKTPNTADLKAFSIWMNGVSQSDFTTQKWAHFDVYKVAAYYCYLMRFGAVDQPVKNAFLTSEDGEKFYFINYDNDTINGLINTGRLALDPTVDRDTIGSDGEYVYAGHNSVLWNRFTNDSEFIEIVSIVDNALYSAGLRYDEVIAEFNEGQADKWVERVYNQDAEYKYLLPYVNQATNNLFMLQGSRSSHRAWWLSKRFSLYDSLLVSGAYRDRNISFKCLNDTQPNQQFTIKAGTSMNFGYGVNNGIRETGVELGVGESHTFTTTDTLNLGDVVKIFGASDLSELDLSAMAARLAVLDCSAAADSVLGSKMKKLILGGKGIANIELSSVSGINKLTSLQEINVEDYQNISSLNLTAHKDIRKVYAKGSGIASIDFAAGAPVEYLELPSAIMALNFNQLPYLTFDNIVFESDLANIHTVNIYGCPNLTNDWGFVRDWFNTKTTENSKCTLVMEGISWTDVEAEQLIALVNIGTLSLKGTIRMSSVDSQQIAAIKAIYGEYVFVKGGELWITAPDGVFIAGASELVEGDSVQLHGDIVSDYPGTLTWEITSGSGATISQDGLLTTTETGSARTVTLRIKHVPTVGAVIYNTKDITIKKAVRPTAGTVSGADAFNSEAEYTLALSPSGINRDYSVVWSLSGTAASGVSIKSSDKDSCVVSAASGAAGDLTVTATVTTDKGVKVTASKTALVGATLKMNILSNQGTDSTIAAVKANITYAGTTVTGKHGDTVAVPANTLITVTFPSVDGYVTPESLEFVTGDKEDEVHVTYYTTVLTVTIADNQSAYNDISGAKATVSAAGMTTKTLSSGGTAKVPTGAQCTITWSSVTDYKSPDTVKFTAEGTSVSKTGTYQTEVVSVSVVSDNAELSVTGAAFTINGTSYTWNGTAVVKKIAFGTTYTITAGKFGELVAPSSVSYVAEQVSRSVVLTYSTVKPDGVDLSLMDIHGNALARHNTANCYVVKEAGWYSFPIVYGNAITNGVANTAAYTKVAGDYSHDFVNYNDAAITSPFVEEDTGVTAAGVELSMCDEDGLISQLHLQNRQLCRYIGFKLDKVPTTGANAVVSVLDGNGVVMWSWHIWVWPDDLTPVTITNATNVNYNILPVNLATKKSSTTAGKMVNWFYQWGRPTPMLPPKDYNSSNDATNYGVKTFAVSSEAASTYGASIQNPQMFYKDSTSPYNWFGSASYYNLWDANCVSTGNSDNNVVKTVYDPCPPGFKMPNGNTFTYFSTTNVVGSFSNGWNFKRNAEDTTGVFFPASGKRDSSSGSLNYVGSRDYVQFSSASKQGYVYFLYINSNSVNPQYSSNCVSGCSVRPVQDGTPLQYAETTIRLDQTISDPSTMITRTVDGGAIEAIRAHSHRYTGSLNSEGVMVLKQLDDNNGTVYLDGSAADLTTLGTDVWMKLPQFYYKAVESSTDVWDITFRFGAAPSGDGWKEWDGKDLIGVYEAYSDGTMLYSVSGKSSTAKVSQANFVKRAHARGNGFTLVRWKHQNIMAFLFYALYGNTNSQAIVGAGTNSSTKDTGKTNALSMIDTDAATNGNSQSINFWGLENWWGNKNEWVEGIVVNNRVWSITEDDGSVRTVQACTVSGYISKIAVGEHLDVICKTASGSETTGFCDNYYQSSSNSRVVLRSNYNSYTHGGVAYAGAGSDSSGSYSDYGSRLAFRGEYVIE